jgi:hypothetical protein
MRVVREMIGRYVASAAAQMSLFRSRSRIKTIDETVPDYEFYDRLRRGKARGYTLGGLFSSRIEKVFAAWVLGSGVEVTLVEDAGDDPDNPVNYTNGLLADFIAALLTDQQNDDEDIDDAGGSLLMRLYRDHLGLGDQYVIVNADGSLSVPSPDTVTVERDELDYRRVLAVKVETRTGQHTIIDEYRADGRTVTVKKGAQIESTEEYDNLLGMIPVVHLAHERGRNETNGHSIHEALRPLYDQYDDVIYKQLDGAKLLGNPLLTFEGMEDVSSVKNANAPATQDTYTDKDGTTQTRDQMEIDSNAVFLVGKGGSAKFIGPQVGFSADTQQALKTLFLLVLDYTGIPEFIWGNELSSARASAEVQLDQWVRDVQGRQRDAQGWLLKLCRLWLRTRAWVDPGVVIGNLQAEWPELLGEDDEVLRKKIELGLRENLLTRATALALLGLVDDPKKEVEEAEAEADARREALFPEGDTFDFQQRLNQEQGDDGQNVQGAIA